MLQLSQETEKLALKVAAYAGREPEALILDALEREAKALGIGDGPPAGRCMTVEAMLALGDKMTALPLRDPRGARDIADDLNEP